MTRQIEWPGGDLLVNADAHEGELAVRVTDARRKPLAGFDYADCTPIRGDGVRQRVAWRGGSLDAQKGQVVRLEFLLKSADLYTFCATGAATMTDAKRPND